MPEVILVDQNDNQIGTMEKLAAHEDGGHLHRAFSVQLFDRQGRMMLQQRASGKYHCPGLWTNTCCSHPAPGETYHQAAKRRLGEEMNMDGDIQELFHFTYRAEFENGLTEYEFDRVFVSVTEQEPILNPEEADSRKWISLDDLIEDTEKNPANYTPRFLIMLGEHIDKFRTRLEEQKINPDSE